MSLMTRVHLALLAVVGLAGAAAGAPARPAPPWRAIQPGVEYAVFDPPGPRPLQIDGRIHVVRIDPARASLRAVMAGAIDRLPRRASQWCRDQQLAVAINMGMYRDDHRTNSGYARTSGYVNNPRWTEKFKSALAFGASPPVLEDLDDPAARERLSSYETVIQNLRLIRAPARGVWAQQDRRWSEAAVAIDAHHRVLFLFARYPHSMKELNDILLSLPLEVVAAMHVEGGPEASLSVHGGGVDVDLNGSYETGFNENDGENQQWPIPNVLAVGRR